MATRGGGKSMAKGSVTTAGAFDSRSKSRPFLVAPCSELGVGILWQTSKLRAGVVGLVTRTWSTGRTRKRSSGPRERGVGQTRKVQSGQRPKMPPNLRTKLRLHDTGVVPANNRLKLAARGPLTPGKQRQRSHATALPGRWADDIEAGA